MSWPASLWPLSGYQGSAPTSSTSSSSESSSPSSPLSPGFLPWHQSHNRRPSSGFQVLSRPANNRSQSSFTATSLHSRTGSSSGDYQSNSKPSTVVSSPLLDKDMSSSQSLPEVTNVLVTQDGDTLAKCDLTGSTGARVVREKIFTKLRIDDSEQDRCTIHRGRFQAGQEGPPLTDQELWDACYHAQSTGGSPPLFFVSISGPTLGAAPLVQSPNHILASENRISSQEQEEVLTPSQPLRSTNPKWHKARASDPESQQSRNLSFFPNGQPIPKKTRRPSSSGWTEPGPPPRPLSPTSSGQASDTHLRQDPSAPEPARASQDSQRPATSTPLQQSSSSARRLPPGARQPPTEPYSDVTRQEWFNGSSSSLSSSTASAEVPRSSAAPQLHNLGASNSRDGQPRDWQQRQAAQQRMRDGQLQTPAHPSTRPDWESQRSLGHPKSKSNSGYPASGTGLPSASHPESFMLGSTKPRGQGPPTGYGASGPVFSSTHAPAGMISHGGFGPTGPTNFRNGTPSGLPASVRPPTGPSSNHNRGPKSSSSRPAPLNHQNPGLRVEPRPNRSLHSARSVDDLRGRPRPSAQEIPPMPRAHRQGLPQQMPPNRLALNPNAQTTRWISEGSLPPRPDTALPSTRAPPDFNSRMPISCAPQPLPTSSSSATLPPPQRMPFQQPRGPPVSLPAGFRSTPYPSPQPVQGRPQQPVSKSPRLPLQRNTKMVQGDHGRPDTSMPPFLRSTPSHSGIDLHEKISLQPGGVLQDAIRSKEPSPRQPSASQAPPAAELPANLRAGSGGVPLAVQITRRQNSASDIPMTPNAGPDHRYHTHTPTSSTSSLSPRDIRAPSPSALSRSSPTNNVSAPHFETSHSHPASLSPGLPQETREESLDDAYAGLEPSLEHQRTPSLTSGSTWESPVLASPHHASSPPLPAFDIMPSAPPMWEDDLPEFGESLQTTKDAEDESSTVKADEWATIVRRIQEGGEDVDTLVPYATGPFPDGAGRDTTIARGTPTELQSGSTTLVGPQPGPQASFGCSLDDCDSDDEDEKTWAVQLGTMRADEVQKIRQTNATMAEAQTSSVNTNKPSLRVEIENLPTLQKPEGTSDSPPKTKQLDLTPTSEALDDQWAVRPSVERVYDNLERFFPDHDLDKPIIDAGAPPVVDSPRESPTASKPTEIVSDKVSHPSPSTGPPPSELQRFKHKKSIRIIAQDRKRFLQKAETAVSRAMDGAATAASGLLRRKSTKLWGIRTEEVTPRQAKLAGGSGPLFSSVEEGSSNPDSASFKWMKGELIGKGSYGKVYLGFNVTTGDMLAIKQVEMPQTSSDKDNETQSSVVNALKSEIGMLQDFDHINIVQFLGYNESPEYLSIFLEYVPGGSVGRCIRKHYLSTRCGFEEPLIKDFTRQIISGLGYLHERGVLHRDLKADNILVDMAGTCKISDFGISKKSDDIYNDNIEMSMQGSIFWMAPEVIDSGQRGYSAKVDIWSLGCVALEMVSGRRPFHEYQMMQALFKLGAGRMAPPVPEDVTVSSEATEFMARCFTILPEHRPTAIELLDDPFMQIHPGYSFARSSLARMLKARE